MLVVNHLVGFGASSGEEAVTLGLAFDIDIGDAASYPGSGQSVFDLSANGYDYYLGSSSGVDATDPTYNAGPPPYLSVDGGDYLSQQAAYSASILRTMGRSDTDFTLEMWAYIPDTAGTSYLAVNISTSGGDNGMLFSVNSAERAVLDVRPSAATLTATNACNAAAWNQIVIAARPNNAATCTHYLNGAPNGTGTLNSTWASGDSTGNLGILGQPGFGGFAASGTRLAIMRAYSRILTDAEVLQNFNAERSRFGI